MICRRVNRRRHALRRCEPPLVRRPVALRRTATTLDASRRHVPGGGAGDDILRGGPGSDALGYAGAVWSKTPEAPMRALASSRASAGDIE
jgi:hypothetical protein